MTAVFDGAVVSEMPRGADVISSDQLPEKHDVTFLELVMEYTEEGSWLRELLSVMIAQYVSTESEGVAPSSGRDDEIPDVSPVMVNDTDDKESATFVDDIPEHEPSSESYLVEHGFDGGTFF